MRETGTAQTLIGFRTAMILYAVLVLAAIATLRGTALALALIIVLGLAVKSVIHYYRERLDRVAQKHQGGGSEPESDSPSD